MDDRPERISTVVSKSRVRDSVRRLEREGFRLTDSVPLGDGFVRLGFEREGGDGDREA